MIEEQFPLFPFCRPCSKTASLKLPVVFLDDTNLCYDLSPTFCLGSRSFN